MIVFVNVGYAISGGLDEFREKILPFLTPPAYTEIQNRAEPALGQWWLLGVLAVMIVFNYLLGEELIFRGILLPKMNGVFRKWNLLPTPFFSRHATSIRSGFGRKSCSSIASYPGRQNGSSRTGYRSSSTRRLTL